jgi:hypothetical protein
MNGTEFPLAYLFLQNNWQCGEGIHTAVIQNFLTKLHEEMNPKFLLTDKDLPKSMLYGSPGKI